MTLRAKCACGQRLKVPDSAAGTRVRCPKCGTLLQLPGAPATVPDVEALKDIQKGRKTGRRPLSPRQIKRRRQQRQTMVLLVVLLLALVAVVVYVFKT